MDVATRKRLAAQNKYRRSGSIEHRVRSRSNSNSGEGERKKRPPLGLIIARQAALCLLVGVLVLGVRGVGGEAGEFLRGLVHSALYHDANYQGVLDIILAMFNSIRGEG